MTLQHDTAASAAARREIFVPKNANNGASAGALFRYDLSRELIFEVRQAEEGGYVARALGQAIFTEAETWAELRDNVLEVTSLQFEDAAARDGAPGTDELTDQVGKSTL
jgi:hypothetical protein